MSLMVTLVASTLSDSYSVSNRFIDSSWNSIFFDPICAASTLGHQLFSFPSLRSICILLITILWSLPMLTWLMTVTSVTMSGAFIRM